MEKVNNLEVDNKKIRRKLQNGIRKSFIICRVNSIVFKFGKFVQIIRCGNKNEISKMYEDFSHANFNNKSYLNFIKENLIAQTTPDDLLMIKSMLDDFIECNNSIISSYNEEFTKSLENKRNLLTETENKPKKILEKNRYFSKYNEI